MFLPELLVGRTPGIRTITLILKHYHKYSLRTL